MTNWEALQRMWDARACFICGKAGACGHREPDFDLAEIHALSLKRIEPKTEKGNSWKSPLSKAS